MSAVAYEYVALGGFTILEVGPKSRRRKIVGIAEVVFLSERDARAAAKEGGGTWAKRRKHKTRRVDMRAARKALREKRR